GRAAGGGCGAAVGGRGGAGVGAVDGQRRRDGDFGGQGPGGGDLLGQEFGGWEFGGRHGAPHANSGAVPASFTAPRPIGNVTTPRVEAMTETLLRTPAPGLAPVATTARRAKIVCTIGPATASPERIA